LVAFPRLKDVILAAIYAELERDIAAYNSRQCTNEALCTNLIALKQLAASIHAGNPVVNESVESLVAAAELRNKRRKNMNNPSRWRAFVMKGLRVSVFAVFFCFFDRCR
jgi:hypothetical protein